MNNCPGIQQYLSLRCEALCAELLSNGILFSDMIIQLKGSSRKRFGRDIENISVLQDDITGKDKLVIEINRDGLYDILPEGLFHQPVNSSVNESMKDKVDNHRKLKEEEREARKFFQPFEQEFMHYATMAEQTERELTLDIFKGNTTKELNSIWEIPDTIPAKAANTLARIMPWLYYIKSDIDATAAVLQLLLEKEVDAFQHIKQDNHTGSTDNTIDNCTLGDNAVLGNDFCEPVLQWTFNIKDIEAGEMVSYTEGHPHNRLLALFTELFIPVEIDVVYDYVLKQNAARQKDNILGYGFVLQ